TDVTFESSTYLFFAWTGVVLEQVIRSHNHAGCAEAALQTMLLPKAFLDGMQTPLRSQSFNGRYLTTIRLNCQNSTSFDRFAIKKDSTRATFPGITTTVNSPK